MITPSFVVKKTIDRLNEILWWNLSLTKLSDPRFFKNAKEFFAEELLQIKGPFIEKILPPELWIDDWESTCRKLNIQPILKSVIADILFNGDVHKHLYYHQGLALQHLSASSAKGRDAIITAPTATGKTECFLMPILDWCIKEKIEKKENNLKAIIIYPMKTLEADQLNRMIQFLYKINEQMRQMSLPPITVGIWDGDTPIGPAGEREGEVGSWAKLVTGQSVRGLECPKHGKRLLWKGFSLGCEEEDCYLRWICVTRNDVREKQVDILITNPEALEFALLSPYNKGFLPKHFERRVAKYVVFDEAHVWSGVGATSLSVFIQRLKSFYESSDPTFILSSATIVNPIEFASELLLPASRSDIVHIRYRERATPKALEKPTYSIEPCKFNVILGLLYCAENHARSVDKIFKYCERLKIGLNATERKNALSMCEKLNLIKVSEDLAELTPEGKQLVSTLSGCLLDDFSENQAFETLDNTSFLEQWASLMLKKVPEIHDLLDLFAENRFLHENRLIEHVQKGYNLDFDMAAEIVATVLNWGRAAQIFLDKYHYFIKPIEHIFWCPEDKIISSKKTCPKCSGQMYQLFLCQRCHEPSALKEGRLEPIRFKPRKKKESSYCRCGRLLDKDTMAGASVSYLTFLTFLLSALTRNTFNQKVLVFSDSRGEVEAVTTFTRSLDYSLVLHQEVCKTILENDVGQGISIKKLHDLVSKRAFDIYFNRTPFDVEEKELRPMIAQYQKLLYRLSEVYGPRAFKGRNRRLFNSSILSFREIYHVFSIPIERALAHYILFEIGYDEDVRYGTVTRRVNKYFYYLRQTDKEGFKKLARDVLNRLIDEGLILKGKNSKGKDIIRLPDIWEHKYRLTIPEKVSYCESCYLGYPSILESCPNCGSKELLNKNNRFYIVDGDKKAFRGFGHLENMQEHAPFILDHWAREILNPALERIGTDSSSAIFIADHRSGLPAVMRGKLEEGFRSYPPTVNVICCTPTMELGIDIGTLNCACMIGIPPTKTNYIQRTGRTGRTMAFPSILMTVIRNQHSVDNHYLNKIEEYLNREAEPLKAPPFTDNVIKQHIVSTCLQFLNYESLDYETKYYDLFPRTPPQRFSLVSKNVKFLERILQVKLRMFFEDLCNNYKEILDYIFRNFEKTGISQNSIHRLLRGLFFGFEETEPEVFDKLSNVVRAYIELNNLMEDRGIDTGDLRRTFMDNFSCLSLCLSQPRLLADYRGIMSSVPVAFSSRRFGQVTLELKSIDHALREAYPGFMRADGNHARGALLRQQGIEYDILNVNTIDKAIFEVEVCLEKECPLAFQSFDKGTGTCPFCKKELFSAKAFPLLGALADSKRRISLVNTTPVVSTHVPIPRGENVE